MSQKMVAVIKKEPKPGVTITEVDIPKIARDEVLVKVKAASICGSDVHIYDWDPWASSTVKIPVIIGHEFTGEIIDKGKDVLNLSIGDYISAESHIPCMTCFQCKNGMMHICDNLHEFGFDRDGGFAEYVSVPAICAWKNAPELPPEIGSIQEPLGNSIHAVTSADVKGKNVAIFGCGPTGLFAIGVAKACGAKKVISIDINRHRLELAKEMKVDDVLDGSDKDLIQKIKDISHKAGVDVVLEMSGSKDAMLNGLLALRKGGTFIAFGISTKPVEIDMANLVITKAIIIRGIFGRLMFKTWEQMKELLDSKKLDPLPVITHRFKLSEFNKAIKTIKSKDVKCGKVVLFPK
jgi:threonine 3-dehydrogenase